MLSGEVPALILSQKPFMAGRFQQREDALVAASERFIRKGDGSIG